MKIADAIAANNARLAAMAENNTPAPTSAPVAPTPSQDQAISVPQRGMFSANQVLASDRSDSSRVFRSSGMRSPAFPFPTATATITNNISTTTTQNSSNVPAPSPSPSPVTPSGIGNQVYATPANGTTGPATLRSLVTADEPSTTVNSVTNDTNITGSIAAQDLTLGWTGELSVARGGTGTSSPSLIGGTNISITGSWPNQTVSQSDSQPVIVEKSLLTAQSGAISATTIYAIPLYFGGLYRISYVATITTIDSTSCTLGGTNGFQVKFTNANGDSVVKTSNPTTPNVSSTNSTGTTISGVVMGYCAAQTNLQYLFGYTAGTGNMRYDLSIFVEYLGA